MNNLLSNCGLVVARISASEKDLPVWVEEEIKKMIHEGIPSENIVLVMAFPVVEFSRQGYKIRKVFG